jgi:hypothetical protein
LLISNTLTTGRANVAAVRIARRAPVPEECAFALLVAGLDVEDDAQCDAYFAAGLDDSVLEDRDGLTLATFSRTATDPASALTSAIGDIELGVRGARVVRVDDQLMNLGDIAAHLGRTAESVRLLATSARGPGGFPPPAGVVGRGVRVWRWADVRPWLAQHGMLDPTDGAETLPPSLIATTNLRLAPPADASTDGASRG